ncbi:MAG: hypothetical protein A2X64_01105 [Ignavibacteria bacterium GWF2_33_9]|nr:MAG: hypothetical protein A2X64_01105 [Ignavibacteria bacterium GWF2_33_9]
MEQNNTEQLLFAITIDDLQYEAKNKMGRELNDEEIAIAKKGLEYGLLSGIDIIYNTIFKEMIK